MGCVSVQIRFAHLSHANSVHEHAICIIIYLKSSHSPCKNGPCSDSHAFSRNTLAFADIHCEDFGESPSAHQKRTAYEQFGALPESPPPVKADAVNPPRYEFGDLHADTRLTAVPAPGGAGAAKRDTRPARWETDKSNSLKQSQKTFACRKPSSCRPASVDEGSSGLKNSGRRREEEEAVRSSARGVAGSCSPVPSNSTSDLMLKKTPTQVLLDSSVTGEGMGEAVALLIYCHVSQNMAVERQDVTYTHFVFVLATVRQPYVSCASVWV